MARIRGLRAVAPLVVLLVATGTFAGAASAGVDLPEIVKGRGERCVEPTGVMRSDHMKFLFHERDQSVIHGIRSKRHSLKECVRCHAAADDSGGYLAVNAKGQFCQSCHGYSAVKIDCFDCHATKPRAND